MERQRFMELRRLLGRASIGHVTAGRCRYADAVIVQVALWAALHHRSILWATRRANWPGDLRPRGGLPSPSRMSRRLRTTGVLTLIDRLEQRMRDALPGCDVQLFDGRPLVVGGFSKDPDAERGYAAGQWQRGYRLHQACNRNGVVNAWHLTTMNVSESSAADLMLDHVPSGGWALADGVYDRNPLYEHAANRGIRWSALPNKPDAKAPGHHAHHPDRHAAWPYVRNPAGRRLVKQHRVRIEQINAWQGQPAINLGPLPHHVRRTHRVRLWVALKLLIYHHWLGQKIQHDLWSHA